METHLINKNEANQHGETSEHFLESKNGQVLIALRRITHSVAQYSRKLSREHQTTGPQLLCLYMLDRAPGQRLPIGELAQQVRFSPSTVNGIVDRLEAKSLVVRQRDRHDRRRVAVHLTDAGSELVQQAPLLQDRLSEGLRKLPALEQAAMALALERMAGLMENSDATDAEAGSGSDLPSI